MPEPGCLGVSIAIAKVALHDLELCSDGDASRRSVVGVLSQHLKKVSRS